MGEPVEPMVIRSEDLLRIVGQTSSGDDPLQSAITLGTLNDRLDTLQSTMPIAPANIPTAWRDTNPTGTYQQWLTEVMGEKAAVSEVTDLSMKNEYIMARLHTLYASQNINKKMWLRARDLDATHVTGQTVSVWNPPSGTTGLVQGIAGVTGTGTLPVFTRTGGSVAIARVRFSGSNVNGSWMELGNNDVLFPFSTGFSMFLVTNVATPFYNPALLGAAFTGTYNDTCGWYTTSTTQLTFRCLGTATQSPVNTATVGAWTITAFQYKPSDDSIHLWWYTATNVPRSGRYAFSFTDKTDRTAAVFRLWCGPGFIGGADQNTVLAFDVAECMYIPHDISLSDFYAIYNQMKEDYAMPT